MPIPLSPFQAAHQPPSAICMIGAALQRFTARLSERPAAEADKARSVADLLEFGYTVTSADRHFPHMPA
jgi:hypothetical protein